MHEQYVKTTSAGNSFVLHLREDGALREWWQGADESEGWDGTWSRVPAPGGDRLRVRIGRFRTDFSRRDGRLTGTELDDDGNEHATATLTPVGAAGDEDTPFGRLLASAQAVARELRDRGVPGDFYESQPPGGERPQAFAPVGGWVVDGLDMEETYRSDLTGAIQGSRFDSVRHEVWLLVDGQLKAVRLRHETVSNNVRGSRSNVVPTRVDVEDLTPEAARHWDLSKTWKRRERRQNGQLLIEEWRAFGRRASGPPCAALASSLEVLRARGR